MKLNDIVYIKEHDFANRKSVFSDQIGMVKQLNDQYSAYILIHVPQMFNEEIWVRTEHVRMATVDEGYEWRMSVGY